MTKETGTPQIRFSGYNDTWEQRKVQDVADRFDNLRIPVAANLRVHGTTPYYGANGIQDFVEGFTHDGEFVLVAEDGANDLKNYPVQCVNGRIWVNNHTHVLQGKAGITDNSFLAFAISQSNIESLLVGGGRAKLNAETLMSIEFRLPCLPEQYRIGEYLTQLDHLITLHQRKYNKLVKVKKSMLEKMFPREGAKVPEIRFYGFTDDWEQRKLLDCIQKITDFRGRTPKKLGMDWSEEGYLALSALNVKDGYIDFNQDVHYGNQELYDKWMTGNELHKGQVLFTTEAPMGNVAQVPDNRRYILSQRTIAFEVKNKLITENFLATVLRTPTVFADLTALSSGGTAKGVSQKSLASVEIRLPKNLNEQEKIANTFYNLDHLITLHQRKLEKLKNLKKACLKKMFI